MSAALQRDRVVKLREHFHGWHDLVVGQTREDDPHPHSVGVPDGFYDSLTIVEAGDVEALEEALAGRDVAAVILEPTGAHYGTDPLAEDMASITAALRAATGIDDWVGTVGLGVAGGGVLLHWGIRLCRWGRPTIPASPP